MPFQNCRLIVTSKCNASCKFCHKEGRILDKEGDIFAVFDRLLELGMTDLQVTGGEPTLHPDFGEFSRRVGLSNLRSSCITTNGLLLAQHREALLKYGNVRVSLHSAIPEERSEIFGVRVTAEDLLYAAFGKCSIPAKKSAQL